jgi:hypothetical protein
MKEEKIYNLITASAKTRFDYETFEKTFSLPIDDCDTSDNMLWLILQYLAMGDKPNIVALKVQSQIMMTGFILENISDLEEFISINQSQWTKEISTLKMATEMLNSNFASVEQVYDMATKILSKKKSNDTNIKCDICSAEYEIETTTETASCFYTCMFCNSKIYDSNHKFIPKKIVNFPPKEIAVPGMIRTALNSYLENYKKDMTKYEILLSPYNEPTEEWVELLINCEKTDDDIKNTGSIVLRVLFYHSDNQVLITNILVSGIFRHQGIGKKLISLIFNVCQLFGYRLILTEMVESFYNRMLNRGAKVIVELDQLEIVSTTQLE